MASSAQPVVMTPRAHSRSGAASTTTIEPMLCPQTNSGSPGNRCRTLSPINSQVRGEVREIADMRARAGVHPVAALVVDEAGNIPARQRLGSVPVAGAVFGDAVHDDESGLRRGGTISKPGKRVPIKD